MTRLRVLCGVAALVVSASLLPPPGASAVATPPPAGTPRRGVVHTPWGELAPPSAGPLLLPPDGPYLHTDGGIIRDARGQPVRLGGVNWSGLETCNFAPSGLGRRSWWDVLD